MSKEPQLIKSPRGKALYPFITISDTKFNPEGVYRVDLVLNPKFEEHKQFLANIKAMLPKDANQLPYKQLIHPETGEKTGEWSVHFSSKFPPKQFDSKGNKIENDKIMANDSIIRVSFIPNQYEKVAGKTGVKLYLQAVQILDFKEWKGADADYYGFEKEEGYIATEDVDDFEDIPKNIKNIRDKAIENEPVEYSDSDDLPF